MEGAIANSKRQTYFLKVAKRWVFHKSLARGHICKAESFLLQGLFTALKKKKK